MLATCSLIEIEPGKDSLVYRGSASRGVPKVSVMIFHTLPILVNNKHIDYHLVEFFHPRCFVNFFLNPSKLPYNRDAFINRLISL